MSKRSFKQAPIGILLINLGTPESPDVPAVRRYLKEFLSDPRVIDLPAFARWCLVNGMILPFRPKQSAHAYQQIWQSQGSPLLIYSKQLCDALSEKLGNEYVVELGMRYGNPSIASALEKLQAAQCRELIILPLFPQYSSAATGSALEKVFNVGCAKKRRVAHIKNLRFNGVHDAALLSTPYMSVVKVIYDFHDDVNFILSQAISYLANILHTLRALDHPLF